jgi:hypothetical protein
MDKIYVKRIIAKIVSYVIGKKFIVLATALLGLPSLSFSSYIIYSRIPLSLIDASTILNFFSSFYLSAIFSLGLARVIILFLENIYRNALISMLERRKRRSSIYKILDAWIDKRKTNPVMPPEEAKLMFASLMRFERYSIHIRFLANKNAENIFLGVNSYYFLISISGIIFCLIFSGLRLILAIPLSLLIISIVIEASFSKKDFDDRTLFLKRTKAALNRILDGSTYSGEEIPDGSDKILAEIKSENRKIKNIIINAYRKSAELFIKSIYSLRNDLGLMAFCVVLFGIVLGVSKYKSDLTLKVLMTIDRKGSECVSPLLLTANHIILYSDRVGGPLIMPYEVASFSRGSDCFENR